MLTCGNPLMDLLEVMVHLALREDMDPLTPGVNINLLRHRIMGPFQCILEGGRPQAAHLFSLVDPRAMHFRDQRRALIM